MKTELIKQFNHKGIECVVLLLDLDSEYSSVIHSIESMWHCGYCGIRKDHPLYERDYSDTLPDVTMKDMKDVKVGKRGIIDIFCSAGVEDRDHVKLGLYFDVHGSITYSKSSGTHPTKEPTGLWWFGFDCHHCDDTIATCDAEYVESECRRFAEQLIEYQKRSKESESDAKD